LVIKKHEGRDTMLKIYGTNPQFPKIPLGWKFVWKIGLAGTEVRPFTGMFFDRISMNYVYSAFFRFIFWSTNSFPLLSNCIGINAVLDFLSFRKVGSVDELNRYSLATTLSLSLIFLLR